MSFTISIANIRDNYREMILRNQSCIEQLMSNMATQHKNIFLKALSNPLVIYQGVPIVTYIIMMSNTIIQDSNRELRNNIVNDVLINKFLNILINKYPKTFDDCSYYIPKYNLYHYGNICHLNSSLLMIASLPGVMKVLNETNPVMLSQAATVLIDVLNNSFSPVDVSPFTLFELINILSIDINELLFADKTITQLVEIIHPYLQLTTFIYWDCADTFIPEYDKKLSLEELVDKYSPKYLIVNGQDFNIVNGIQQDNQFRQQYVTKHNTYVLASFIMYLHGHYIILFANNKGQFIIRDDVYGRYDKPSYNISMYRHTQVTLVCYIKVC